MARIMVHGESDSMTELMAGWLEYKGHEIIQVEVSHEGRMGDIFHETAPDLIIVDNHVMKEPASRAMVVSMLEMNPDQNIIITYSNNIPSFFSTSARCSSDGFKESIGIDAPNIFAACKLYTSTDLLKMVEAVLELDGQPKH